YSCMKSSLLRRGTVRMRALFLALSGVCLVALSVPIERAFAAEGPLAGHVVSVSGSVLLRKDGKEAGAPHQLKPGDQVRQGDVINTSSDGKAKLLLQDRTIVDVGSSALFHVSKFAKNNGEDRDVELSMKYGTVRANVTRKLDTKGKFRVRTPSATMGVRGTQFVVMSGLDFSPTNGESVSAPASKTEVVVIDG